MDQKIPDRTKDTSLPAHVTSGWIRSNVRQDFGICFQPTEVQVSALCLRRTGILDARCVSRPTLIHCAPRTLRGLVVTEDIHFLQVMSPSAMARRHLLMRNGQATRIP